MSIAGVRTASRSSPSGRFRDTRPKTALGWREDAPDACGNGHGPVLPGQSTCPRCHYTVRVWRCRQDCGATVYDDARHC